MLPAKSLSLINLLLHHHYFLPTPSAFPLSTERPPFSTLAKRAHLEYLVCPGPLPSPPYPQAPLFMRAHTDATTHATTVLAYTDPYGDREYIFEREGLCTRAGCECILGSIVCNNFEYIFFSQVLYNWYAAECYNTCTCRFVRATHVRPISVSGETKNVTVDLTQSPERGSVNTVNRLNPEGTAGGFAGCLAGEAAGWTVQGVAKCCVGYVFHALTAQEVYETYGVAPYASDVIAAASTIGVCLKNL